MRYTKLGKTDLNISSLGFGAMNLPGVPMKQASEALNYALDQGINYIDTAAAYRNSEEIIGSSIAHRRQEYFLATKTAQRTYDEAKSEIERSLKRMKTETIDLIQIHYVNYVHEFKQLMDDGGAYHAALDAQREGKVRYIGITGHRPDLLAKWIAKGHFDQVLFHLNLAQPFALDNLIPTATQLDMMKIAMKPLSGGFIQPVDKAIRYPFSQNVHVTISGMVSKQEVIENLSAQQSEVDSNERAELEQLAQELGAHDCRRCNYCSCPLDISIPDFMISSIFSKKYGLLTRGAAFYGKQKDRVLSCVDYEPCKETPLCEEKCPYHLPMQKVIHTTAASFK
jgi:predicted aldo/keto reductase-like oxidoreductase